MKIGYVQFNPKFGKKTLNLKKIEHLVKQVKGADLLVLPEMATTGYMVNNRKELLDLAEAVPNGPSTKILINIAKEAKTTIVIGLPEKQENMVYSTALTVGPNGYIGKYRKVHRFLKETLYFDPGNLDFPVYDIGKAKIGVGVCFDYMFPEVWRTLVLKGAQIFCLPTNLVLPYCMEVMKIRSLENGCFSISTNRIGTERSQTFTGGSHIIGTRMEILQKAGKSSEEIGIVEVDLKKADDKMVTKYNHLINDRMTRFYKTMR